MVCGGFSQERKRLTDDVVENLSALCDLTVIFLFCLFACLFLKKKLTNSKIIQRTKKTIFLPGFNGTFNRQGAVNPVIDGLL